MLDSLIPGCCAHRPSLAPGGSTHTHAVPPAPARGLLASLSAACRAAGPAGHRRTDSLIQGPGKAWAKPGQGAMRTACREPGSQKRAAAAARRDFAHISALCENNKDVSRRAGGALTWLVLFRARPGCRVPLSWNAPRGHRKRLASGQCSAWCSGRSRRAHGSARQRA